MPNLFPFGQEGSDRGQESDIFNNNKQLIPQLIVEKNELR